MFSISLLGFASLFWDFHLYEEKPIFLQNKKGKNYLGFPAKAARKLVDLPARENMGVTCCFTPFDTHISPRSASFGTVSPKYLSTPITNQLMEMAAGVSSRVD